MNNLTIRAGLTKTNSVTVVAILGISDRSIYHVTMERYVRTDTLEDRERALTTSVDELLKCLNDPKLMIQKPRSFLSGHEFKWGYSNLDDIKHLDRIFEREYAFARTLIERLIAYDLAVMKFTAKLEPSRETFRRSLEAPVPGQEHV